ncbi:hypothetical protein BGW38_008437, partial [Lunasporangiospora selenospora]
GHALWFMVAAEDRLKVETLFKRHGYPLALENLVARVEILSKADFPIYVVEQKVGDLIVVPSLGYHQVHDE